MINKFDIFINKYINTQLSLFKQKKIPKLFKKDIFKIIIFNKVVMLKKILNSIKIFNFWCENNVKDLYIDKMDKKIM